MMADFTRRVRHCGGVPTPKPIDPEVAARFGQTLQSIRADSGLSQEEIAQRAGLSRNYYQLLEIGLSSRSNKTPANPSLAVLIDLAHALDVPLTRLVFEVFKPLEGLSVELNNGTRPQSGSLRAAQST